MENAFYNCLFIKCNNHLWTKYANSWHSERNVLCRFYSWVKAYNKKRYFNHNFKILKKELGNKDSIVVHYSNVKEFIGVLEDMGDFGIIKNPYHMVISAQQYHTVLNWYKKVSRIITLSMLKKFIKRNYMALCSDYEIEQMEILLSQYKKRLRLYYIMRINNMPQQ